jgi:hypothetical protein
MEPGDSLPCSQNPAVKFNYKLFSSDRVYCDSDACHIFIRSLSERKLYLLKCRMVRIVPKDEIHKAVYWL